MRHLIYALGAVLVACGIVGLVWSIDLAGLERGTTYASAGASLLGAGVVTLALGRVVQLLERIAGDAGPRPAAARRDGASTPDSAAARAAGRAAAGEAKAPAPGPTRGVAAVALAAAQAEAALAEGDAPAADDASSSGPAPAKTPAPSMSDSPARDAPPIGGEPAGSVSPSGKETSERGGEPAAGASDRPTALRAPEPRAESGPGGVDPFSAGATAAPAPKPQNGTRIVGRYQANGVDYALFSDGSIEAERNGVKQRFSSLVELKQFIEQS